MVFERGGKGARNIEVASKATDEDELGFDQTLLVSLAMVCMDQFYGVVSDDELNSGGGSQLYSQ